MFLGQDRLFGSLDSCTEGGVALEESLLSLFFVSEGVLVARG